MRVAALIGVVFACMTSGCGTARMYEGPRLPPESVSRVATQANRANIVRTDGQLVNSSEIELMPGEHELEFSWSTTKMIGSLFPVLETNCYVEAELEAGRRYVFEQNESREVVGKRPPMDFRWTVYRVDPKFVDEKGSSVGKITCNPTCRAHGKKSSDARTADCKDVLEPRVIQPLAEVGDNESARSPESVALSRIILDRLQDSCAGLRDIRKALCLARRAPNHISYLSGDGTLLIAYPDDDTRLRPGLRDEARSECLGEPPRADAPACLNRFGWVLLP